MNKGDVLQIWRLAANMFNKRTADKGLVHRFGPGGSMLACHAAGPGSIPGRDKFPG